MKKTKVQKSNDVYPLVLACNLDKEGNILIFEAQPLVSSGLGSNSSRLIPAFEKAFPGFSFTLDYNNIQQPPEKLPPLEKVFFSDIAPRGDSIFQSVHIPKYAPSLFLNFI